MYNLNKKNQEFIPKKIIKKIIFIAFHRKNLSKNKHLDSTGPIGRRNEKKTRSENPTGEVTQCANSDIAQSGSQVKE